MSAPTCAQLRLLTASDDPGDRHAMTDHTRRCEACRAFLDDLAELADGVAAWRAGWAGPPARLERSILKAAPRPRGAATRIRRLAPRFALAAATLSLLAGAAAAVLLARPTAPPGSLARAVLDAQQARDGYARAIVRLQEQVDAELARASDPGLAPREAARLLAYRDRLRHLDEAIGRIQGFLAEHPGHAAGHALLMAAYQDKSDLLQEILHRTTGEIPS